MPFAYLKNYHILKESRKSHSQIAMGLFLLLFLFYRTVTVQTNFFLPTITVIFALPFLTAVIFPLDVTFTIFLLEVLYFAL